MCVGVRMGLYNRVAPRVWGYRDMTHLDRHMVRDAGYQHLFWSLPTCHAYVPPYSTPVSIGRTVGRRTPSLIIR